MESFAFKVFKLRHFICSKTFHASIHHNSLRQIGRTMNKILRSTKKRQFEYPDTAMGKGPAIFQKSSLPGKGGGNPRRVSVLNKLFMSHISDQMATGECASDLLGYGIEINRVQVTPDYKMMKVYWITRCTEHDEEIEKILQKCAGPLRSELTQMRLMDMQYAFISELDSRLAIADFGDGYVPIDPLIKLKTEFELYTPLDTEIKKQIEELDQEKCEDDDPPLPPMPQNVMGLNHADILNRITINLKKSKALHREKNLDIEEEDCETFKLSLSTNENPIQFKNTKSQKEALKKFLQKRQLLKQKARDAEKKNASDLDHMWEELQEKQFDYQDFGAKDDTEEDYILDEEK